MSTDLAPWLTRTHGTTRPAPAPRARVVIEVDADDAQRLVEQLRAVGNVAPLVGATAILAACTRARVEAV